MTPKEKSFLFLQGPHGPFFWQLAKRLRTAQARCHRIGFNRGDRLFWPDGGSFTACEHGLDDWPDAVTEAFVEHDVTDLVLYGDTRPIHAEAIRRATLRGITVHVFEEGYLRPWWITYERGGSNGHSPIMRMPIDAMAAFLDRPAPDPVEAPGHWGALLRHMFYGAVYHGAALTGPQIHEPHRGIPLSREFALHLRRLVLMPFSASDRIRVTGKIRYGGFPYHLVLLQLDHDASLRHHGPFATTAEFLTRIVSTFASHAPPHHHLVVKAHPLEDGRVSVRRLLRELSKAAGVEKRVHYVGGGKLARLLSTAKSVITVNSTAAQQALMRGIPVKAFGRGVYCKPEFVSEQPLETFFANPQPPVAAAYAVFRQFLLETSQLPGSFYAASGRRQALRLLTDIMLAPQDRYARTPEENAAQAQHMGDVRG